MLALIAFSIQAAVTAKFNLNPTNDPNIIVPESSAIHMWDVNKPHTTYLIYNGPKQNRHGTNPSPESLFGPLDQHANPPGFWPADIRNAYNVTALSGSKAICLIDNTHYPTALADFNTFSKQFGLPVESSTNATSSSNQVFQVVYEHGSVPGSSDAGWNGEEALDIEWAHAIAPNAKIYVVESDDGNLDLCNQIASALLNVKEVSNSWSFPNEGPGASELQLDQYYVRSGVTFFASCGDIGGLQGYPATSPNVIGIGGTSLVMDATNTKVVSETTWAGGGGGPSLYEPIPAFQQGIPSVANQLSGKRGTPDISAIADPNTGVPIYVAGAWEQIGGTSLACPVCAALTNDWSTQGGLFQASSIAQNVLNYSLLGTTHFRDITSGTTSGFRSYTAKAGWDFATGIGVPLNLENLPTFYNYLSKSASTLSGTYVSGNAIGGNGQVTSLATAGDGIYYVVNAQTQPNLGSVADVRAQFVVSGQPQNKIAGASVTVTGYANTPNAVEEIFLYNFTTKNYDLVSAPVLPTANASVTVNLSTSAALQYIDANGNVVVLSRALLPQRLALKSNTNFSYKVDQIVVSYGYIQ